MVHISGIATMDVTSARQSLSASPESNHLVERFKPAG